MGLNFIPHIGKKRLTAHGHTPSTGHTPEMGREIQAPKTILNHHMKKPTKLPAPVEPDWASIRPRYEARDEMVAEIARSLGMKLGTLTSQAKLLGWAMRSSRQGVKKITAHEPKPITSTKEAINRLKELVQHRIARLEQSLAGNNENERGINSASLLARTLEKVLELEEQQRKQSRLAAHENSRDGKRRDDAWREELAGRITRLGFGERDSTKLEPSGGEIPTTGLAFVGT